MARSGANFVSGAGTARPAHRQATMVASCHYQHRAIVSEGGLVAGTLEGEPCGRYGSAARGCTGVHDGQIVRGVGVHALGACRRGVASTDGRSCGAESPCGYGHGAVGVGGFVFGAVAQGGTIGRVGQWPHRAGLYVAGPADYAVDV